jgi:hypothetical protein
VQRHVLYLGEINDAQQAAWCRTIEAFDERGHRGRQIALFAEDRIPPALDCDVVQVRLSGLRLHRPRQWGACWLACELWDQLQLDAFWSPRLPPSRQGPGWLSVLKTLVAYQLTDPGRSGGCTGSGMTSRRWPTCWARTSRSPARTRCIAASTSC